MNEPSARGAADTGRLAERVAAALAQRPEVLDGYLFGSQATGRAAPHSDVDVAVYVDPERARDADHAFGYVADLTAHLIAGLQRNDVDVVVLNRADPLLYHRVIRDGVRVLSRDPQASTTREGYALSRYFDFLPQLRKIEAGRRAARDDS